MLFAVLWGEVVVHVACKFIRRWSFISSVAGQWKDFFSYFLAFVNLCFVSVLRIQRVSTSNLLSAVASHLQRLPCHSVYISLRFETNKNKKMSTSTSAPSNSSERLLKPS